MLQRHEPGRVVELERRRHREPGSQPLEGAPAGAGAADVEPDAVPVPAEAHGTQDGLLVLLGREAPHGDHVHQAVGAEGARRGPGGHEGCGHAVGDHGGAGAVAVVGETARDHLAGAVDAAHAVVEPTAEQRVHGAAHRGRRADAGVVGDVLGLQVEGRRCGHAVGARPPEGRPLQGEREEEVHEVHAPEGAVERVRVRLAEPEAAARRHRGHHGDAALRQGEGVVPLGAHAHEADLVTLSPESAGVAPGGDGGPVGVDPEVVHDKGDAHGAAPLGASVPGWLGLGARRPWGRPRFSRGPCTRPDPRDPAARQENGGRTRSDAAPVRRAFRRQVRPYATPCGRWRPGACRSGRW